MGDVRYAALHIILARRFRLCAQVNDDVLGMNCAAGTACSTVTLTHAMELIPTTRRRRFYGPVSWPRLARVRFLARRPGPAPTVPSRPVRQRLSAAGTTS